MHRTYPAQRQLLHPSRWSRAAIGAAAVGLGVALGIAVGLPGWRASGAAASSPATANPGLLVGPAPVRQAQLAAPLAAVVVASPTTHAKGKAASAAAQRTEVEICGYGTVALRPDDPYPFQGIPQALRESALDAAEALMLANDDIQVNAAALWIGMQRGKRDAHGRIEQMARLAIGSQDPVVYALAVEACKTWPAQEYGSCSLISRAQWAQLDPDNAVPWLELAAQARENNAADTEAQALGMAAHARHVNTREGVLPTLVDRALGNRVTPLQRTLALSESWSAQAVWAVSHAPHLSTNGRQRLQPPDVDLDLSCDNVNRMQDWMRQRNNGDDVALAQ